MKRFFSDGLIRALQLVYWSIRLVRIIQEL